MRWSQVREQLEFCHLHPRQETEVTVFLPSRLTPVPTSPPAPGGQSRASVPWSFNGWGRMGFPDFSPGPVPLPQELLRGDGFNPLREICRSGHFIYLLVWAAAHWNCQGNTKFYMGAGNPTKHKNNKFSNRIITFPEGDLCPEGQCSRQ